MTASAKQKRWNPKDPQETVDYRHDWATELDAGDTIATSEWELIGAGVSQTTATNTTTAAVVWVSGGVAGEEALLVNTVTTAGGRTFQRTSVLPIQQR